MASQTLFILPMRKLRAQEGRDLAPDLLATFLDHSPDSPAKLARGQPSAHRPLVVTSAVDVAQQHEILKSTSFLLARHTPVEGHSGCLVE